MFRMSEVLMALGVILACLSDLISGSAECQTSNSRVLRESHIQHPQITVKFLPRVFCNDAKECLYV